MSRTPSPRSVRLVTPLESPRVTRRSQRWPTVRWRAPDDRDLARRLGRIGLIKAQFAVWQHLSQRERPGSCEGARAAGGRFNAPDSFPVIYGALSRTVAGAELRRIAARNPIGLENFLPRHVYRFRITSDNALDLREPSTREDLGFARQSFSGIPASQTQLLGELSRALGIEVLIAPSSTGYGNMIAIFPDLIPVSSFDTSHMELWISINDVPGAASDRSQGFSSMTG